MWNDFSEYIIANYGKASRIVEVGVGGFTVVAFTLKEHLNLDIVMTDIKPYANITVDDITDPDLEIYRDADLIYSIRPPEELQQHIIRVAEYVGADLIIKPLSSEFIVHDKTMKLVNYKKAIFYKKCEYEMAE